MCKTAAKPSEKNKIRRQENSDVSIMSMSIQTNCQLVKSRKRAGG